MPADPAVIRLALLNETSPNNRIGKAVLERAYAMVGQPVQFVELPLRRSMQMMLAGSLDGELFRIASLAEREPTLHQIATPIVAVESRAYANRDVASQIPSPLNWRALAGYKVAYERGSLNVEESLQGIAKLIQAVDVTDTFRLVNTGAADVALLGEPKDAAPNPLAARYQLVRLDTPVAENLLYHYLGSRHGELAQKLDKALRQMQASGQLDALRRKVLKDMALQ